MTDSIPTIFYKQPFEYRHLDSRFNYFEEMNRQAYPLAARAVEPYKIYLMDAYSLHRADLAKEDQYRTFARIIFSKHRYDRLGEADNPMFQKWERTPRFIPTELKVFEPTAENFVGPGFVPGASESSKSLLRTVDSVEKYVLTRLGPELIQKVVRENKAHVVVALGSMSEALSASHSLGWRWFSEVKQSEGIQGILKGVHESGVEGYLLVSGSTPESLIYTHSLLRLAGVQPERVYTTRTFLSEPK